MGKTAIKIVNPLLLKDSELFIDYLGNKAGKCRRQLYYEMMDTKGVIDSGIQRRYFHFKAIKETYLFQLSIDDNCIGVNVPYENLDLRYIGICDAVFRKDDELVGYFLRIITSRSYIFIEKTPRVDDLLVALGCLASRFVPTVIIEYVGLAGEHPIVYTIQLAQDGQLLINNLRHQWLNKKMLVLGLSLTRIVPGLLPKKDFDYRYDLNTAQQKLNAGLITQAQFDKLKQGYPIGDHQCRYCKYLTMCYNIPEV